MIMASLSIENMEDSVSDRDENRTEENGQTSEDEERSSSSPSSSAILIAECRICQVEEFIDQMASPCRCNGTLKFAHRACVQQWINSRLNTTCEICNQPYEGGYRITVRPPAPPLPPTRRAIEEVERRNAAAARVELYRARLMNTASPIDIGRCVICHIALVVVIGFYILIMVVKVGGTFRFWIGPPSPSPTQPQATPPIFTGGNISPGYMIMALYTGFGFDHELWYDLQVHAWDEGIDIELGADPLHQRIAVGL